MIDTPLPYHRYTPYYCYLYSSFFFLIIPPPPTSTLFPYTTLFRSSLVQSEVSRAPRQARHAARLGTAPAQSTPKKQPGLRSEEHTSELQSRLHLVCRLLLEKKKQKDPQLPYTQTDRSDVSCSSPTA